MPLEIFFHLQLVLKEQIENFIREVVETPQQIEIKSFKKIKTFLSNLFKKSLTNNLLFLAQTLNKYLKSKSSNRETFFYFTRLDLFMQFFLKSWDNKILNQELIDEKMNILLSNIY